MVRSNELREGELAVEMPAPRDAGLVFIGRIRTPWTSRLERPGPRVSRCRGKGVMMARSAGSRFSSHGCRR